MLRAALLAVALSSFAAVAEEKKDSPPPKPLTDAISSLEKALADSKDPAEKEKIQDAITALKRVAASPTVQNHLISEYQDAPLKLKDRTLTFQATYNGGRNFPLRNVVGFSAEFACKDPNNGANVILLVDIPKGLEVPNAVQGDVLLVTFKASGKLDGNTALSITRPKK